MTHVPERAVMRAVSIRLNHLVAKRLIESQGRSVTAVAAALGMDRPNLAHCLAGRRRFPAERISDLAEVLGVSPFELLGPEDPRAAVIELARQLGVRPEELRAVPA